MMLLGGLLFAGVLFAHGVERGDADFLERNAGHALLAFMYLGAKHMITGYDHLLYLLGVIFFLYRPKDIAVYVTLFAVGHSITLLSGVLGQINVNAYLVDAVIGLSVAYKAFENLDGFKRIFDRQLNPKIAVFSFGLVHGFGLAGRAAGANQRLARGRLVHPARQRVQHVIDVFGLCACGLSDCGLLLWRSLALMNERIVLLFWGRTSTSD